MPERTLSSSGAWNSAGDIVKEASDSGLPLIGVGFMYPECYFHQHLNSHGGVFRILIGVK
jgi:glycogen phosphorylase